MIVFCGKEARPSKKTIRRKSHNAHCFLVRSYTPEPFFDVRKRRQRPSIMFHLPKSSNCCFSWRQAVKGKQRNKICPKMALKLLNFAISGETFNNVFLSFRPQNYVKNPADLLCLTMAFYGGFSSY